MIAKALGGTGTYSKIAIGVGVGVAVLLYYATLAASLGGWR
jgi:hypothetical protein